MISLKQKVLPPEALQDPGGYLQVLKNRFAQGLETAIGTGTYNTLKGKHDYGLLPWEDSSKVYGVSDIQKGVPIPEKIAYAGGRVGGTLASDNLRNWFWQYNHPLAIASSLGRKIPQSAGLTTSSKGADRIPAVLGGFALATALDLGSGNTDLFNATEGGRPKGYSALLPKYDDPTESKNLAIEIPLGYVTGRKGKLLPWEEFSLERPDISMEKYKEYQDYQAINTPAFFGLEQVNPILTGSIGAGLGALKGASQNSSKDYSQNSSPSPRNPNMKRGKAAVLGAVLGGLAGAAAPGAADLLSRMGIIKGTWSNLEGMPEAQLLGYKVDAKGALIAAGAGAGLHLGSRYLANRKAQNLQEFRALERQRELQGSSHKNLDHLLPLEKKMRSLDPNTRRGVEDAIYQEDWSEYLDQASPEMRDRVLSDLARRSINNPVDTSKVDMNLVNKVVEDYRRRKGLPPPSQPPETS